MKRVGLKFCGGCNPSYDRVGYVRRVQEWTAGRIEWVPFDAGGFDTVVIVTGCDKACVEGIEWEEQGVRVIRIRNCSQPPREVVSLLLGEEDEP
ncbi:MAG: hypothetical protein AB1640_10155 [bacterium]